MGSTFPLTGASKQRVLLNIAFTHSTSFDPRCPVLWMNWVESIQVVTSVARGSTGSESVTHNICGSIGSRLMLSHCYWPVINVNSVFWTFPPRVPCTTTICLKHLSDDINGQLKARSIFVIWWWVFTHCKKDRVFTWCPRHCHIHSPISWPNAVIHQQSALFSCWIEQMSDRQTQRNTSFCWTFVEFFWREKEVEGRGGSNILTVPRPRWWVH